MADHKEHDGHTHDLQMETESDGAAGQATVRKVPVTILTGFLGSGKTTLLNHILEADHGKLPSVSTLPSFLVFCGLFCFKSADRDVNISSAVLVLVLFLFRVCICRSVSWAHL